MWDTLVDAIEILRARREHKKNARKHLDIKYGLQGADAVSAVDEEGDEDSVLDDDAWLFDYREKTNPISPSGSEPLHHPEIGENHCQMQYRNRDMALRKKLIKYDRHCGTSRAKYRAAKRLLANSAAMDYPYLYEWRWEVIVGSSRGVVVGRGDLVFTDGNGSFAVIKLDDERCAHRRVVGRNTETAQRRRRNAQALRYARIYGRLYPQVTTIVPMLMNREGLFVYKDEKWSKQRIPPPPRIRAMSSWK